MTTESTALVSNTPMSPGRLVPLGGLAPQGGSSLPSVPWRDPHDIAPGELTAYIRHLEHACLENPRSADLRTCLGMAHAVNYDIDKSMEALEDARTVEPDNFWAQLKYAELHYRLRVLDKAEEETRRAAELASSPIQLALARKQAQDIRTLKHSCVRNVHWTKPLTVPALLLSFAMAAIFVVMLWK
jgi:tetratricopeptide (TPR) repeat protein